MSIISKQDTNGVKPLLLTGELGYDNYPAGGDVGRVFVGTGTENIGLAKKTEVMAVDGKADTHIARVDNPHNVTKAQVGLGNADNTADVDKNVLSATKLTTPRNITISGEVAGSVSFDGSTDINISTTIQPNSVALGTDTTGNYVDSVIAGEGITVTGVVGEGGTPSIAIAPVGTSGTYTKVSTNDKGQVVSGELLTANDIPDLDASKITSGVIDAARLPASAGNIPEYATLSEFPIVGDSGKVYIALDTNKMYRWSGSTYVSIAGGVDSVAGKTGAVSLDKGDVGLANVDNTADASKNVLSATKLATAITINGVSFNGTANITIADSTKAPLTGGGTSGTWGISITGNASTANNAALAANATKLATARTLTVGNTGKAFDGTANVSWSLAEIGALPSTGGTMTGRLDTKRSTPQTTLHGLVAGESAPIIIPECNVGTTYGYVPWMHHSVLSDHGYRNQNIIGSYRPEMDWTNSGIFIATGGNDYAPTEAFLFQNGRKISNTAGAIILDGNSSTATKLATARTINGVAFDGTTNITVADSTKVPLNGAGASGTWGINITGNAATASSSSALSGFTNTNKLSPINPNDTVQNTIGYAVGLNLLGQVDGAVYSQAYDATWQHQIYGDYRTGKLAVRGKNSGTWSPWKEIATTDGNVATATTATNVSGGKATVRGTGNDYHLGGVEVIGNGPDNTVFPTIGFHQPGLYASSLQLRGSGDFRFYTQGGGSYANVTANTFIGNLSGYANTAGYAGTVAAATSTVSGGIKARLDGTTLYITTNGANA